MSPASFTPEQDLHFVLCDFGRSGQAYVETDPTQADASTIVRNLLHGQYTRPVRVLALNVEEGWVRDVSQVIAAKVRDVARCEEQGLTGGTRGFMRRTATLPSSNRCCPFGSDRCGLDPRDYSIRFVTNDGSELKFSARFVRAVFDELKGR